MGIWSVKVIEGSILSGRAREGSATTLKDDAKNLESNVLKDKLIKINLDGIEYVRKITANTADTFTFATIGTAVAAKAVLDNTATGGGKVTITADPVGVYANEYTVETVKGEGENADTEASFADGVLTLTLGTGAGTHAEAVIGTESVNQILIQAKDVGPIEGYSIEITQNSGVDVPLSTGLFEDTGRYIIGLGTDINGDPDDTKNTVGNIVNALNDNIHFSALFVAASDYGSGVHDTPIAAVSITGGADPAVDSTAAEVKTAIEAIEGGPFTVVADTPGVIDVLASPVSFSGGLDEVKPIDRTEYFVV
jgi:hypothetical protein